MAERPFDRVRVTVIDGVGCGEETDRREKYPKDIGVNSLAGASKITPLDVPALQSMGLEHIPDLEELRVAQAVARKQIKWNKIHQPYRH